LFDLANKFSVLSVFAVRQRCALCETPASTHHPLCAACEAGLPRNSLACAICALPLPTATSRCGRCQKKKLLIERICAPYRYDYPLDSLILRFKKHGDLACGQLLASLCAAQFNQYPEQRPQALVPVPLHDHRLRERGYDQALLLSRTVGVQTNVPVCAALTRIRNTGSQAGLSARARAVNVRRAFSADPRQLQQIEHVALIDDVATTAATLNACALALRRAGVRRVDAWVIARA
jgi:ComF family protein